LFLAVAPTIGPVQASARPNMPCDPPCAPDASPRSRSEPDGSQQLLYRTIAVHRPANLPTFARASARIVD
jgi:hypothetical protein